MNCHYGYDGYRHEKVNVKLFGAVGDPEEVVEFLGVAGVGIVGAFVFVFDVGAGGLHSLASFSGGVACAALDGAAGGFGKSEGGESHGESDGGEG